MKKKFAVMGISAAVGAAMLVTTAYAGVSSSSGYDLYKTAFNNMHQAKSLTTAVNVSVTDNGSKLLTMSNEVKMNRDTKAMSDVTTIDAANQQKTMNVYSQNGTRIMKSSDSDVYKVLTFDGVKKHHSTSTGKDTNENGEVGAVENVIDALTQNIQNNITLKAESDGSSDVELKLSNDQLPPVVNALASLAVQNGMNRMENHKQTTDPFASNVMSAFPKLTGNIKVDNVDITANISKDSIIQHQTANIEVTGNDANGKAHDITINVTADLSNYNSTTPDTVDLNGKKVQKIQAKDLTRHNEQE
ncbi:hypothetical protein [Aneurinibacillus terranovensis]|uniref:hypothetical protein n=1 Tax=Aneurinibacillus terranovensis TaxID=278991 RepID=UPI0003FD5CEF|nr:hypothetical protein [Aneurinibacillus terranovensis]